MTSDKRALLGKHAYGREVLDSRVVTNLQAKYGFSLPPQEEMKNLSYADNPDYQDYRFAVLTEQQISCDAALNAPKTIDQIFRLYKAAGVLRADPVAVVKTFVACELKAMHEGTSFYAFEESMFHSRSGAKVSGGALKDAAMQFLPRPSAAAGITR